MANRNNIDNLRNKIKSNSNEEDGPLWSAVSSNYQFEVKDVPMVDRSGINFSGKILEEGKFKEENLSNSNFSACDLSRADFSGSNLKNVDFSGANLTDANLSNCDLSGAILNGAMLVRTNFEGAKLNSVKLQEANLEDAILLGIEIDDVGLEELQALIEFLAKYYPHKLNLAKMNLSLLDLKKIDLSKVSLRGVDFTGVNFTGVSLAGLDLSETNITPAQIAQALGRVPTPMELKQIMAPKKKVQNGGKGVDMNDFFIGDKTFGTWDTTKTSVSIDSILKLGKKVFGKSPERPPVKDEHALEFVKSEQELKAKSHNQELRKIIEERKKAELENRASMKKEFIDEVYKSEKTNDENEKQQPQNDKSDKSLTDRIVSIRDRGRD